MRLGGCRICWSWGRGWLRRSGCGGRLPGWRRWRRGRGARGWPGRRGGCRPCSRVEGRGAGAWRAGRDLVVRTAESGPGNRFGGAKRAGVARRRSTTPTQQAGLDEPGRASRPEPSPTKPSRTRPSPTEPSRAQFTSGCSRGGSAPAVIGSTGASWRAPDRDREATTVPKARAARRHAHSSRRGQDGQRDHRFQGRTRDAGGDELRCADNAARRQKVLEAPARHSLGGTVARRGILWAGSIFCDDSRLSRLLPRCCSTSIR
jgi:hypothetical protein